MSAPADLNPVLRTALLPAPSHPAAEGERAPFLHDESETFLKKRGGLNPTARSGVLLPVVRMRPGFDLEEELP